MGGTLIVFLCLHVHHSALYENLLKGFLNLGGTEPKPRVTCQINRNETKASQAVI